MKSLLTRFGLLIVTALTAVTLGGGHASAAVDYTNGHLMDDQVFDNVNTMTEQQIRDFINSRPNTCLTTVGSNYGGGAIFPEPKDYWTYGPNNVDAARVIYVAAQYSGINPQVIISTMQKEQHVFTDNDCVDGDGFPTLHKVMGQGCFEGQACPAPPYDGFSQQVMKGAWQLEFNRQRATGNVNWGDNGSVTYSGPWTEGTWQACGNASQCPPVYHDGYWTIDGQQIKMETGATASLYRFTPHLGQAFPGIFEGWFGSVLWHGDDPIGSLDAVQAQPGKVRLVGWGFDRSMAGSGAANIHVYIDGVWQGVLTANTSRPDVGAIYPTQGNNHGFDGTVPYTTAGTHQVCAWVVGDSLGAANFGLGCQSVYIQVDPFGTFDAATAGPSAVSVSGWGFDHSLASPANIHVYIDGAFQGAIAATASRPDVGAAYPDMGNNRGFTGTFGYTTAGTHQVCAWVVGDSIGAANFGLGCKAISVNNDPLGSLDVAQPASGGIRLAGWGFDRSLAGPAAIHVYIDGVFQGAISANTIRADVGSVYPVMGNSHGFDTTLSYATAGTHQVCAWVVGDSIGAPNYGLGCRSVKL